MGNSLFYKALFFSFFIHLVGIVFFSLSPARPFQKSLKRIEVTYQAIKTKQENKNTSHAKNLRIIKEEKFSRRVKLPLQKPNLFSSLGNKIRDVSKATDNVSFSQKQVPKIKILESERKISIPIFKMEKITNPNYVAFTGIMKRKILQCAYKKKLYRPEFGEGSVYLSFVLLSDGRLKQIKIIDEKTAANNDLRHIGLNMVEESVPFAPFPQEYQIYPELTFNVLISFEDQ
ncbi:MAG TPA: hypothetical protein DD723_03890 [Candidatus Omnitrophica bacterium]|nr:MAG: hypothetical protein A2Z81_00405 [Omnitrophica WOR_2 bacterium GWA2_45_18]HBR14672.1 hypothetical protein [Candidatus Omnitrophota bacterium]